MAKRITLFDKEINALQVKNDLVVSYEKVEKELLLKTINNKNGKLKNNKTNITKLNKLIKENTSILEGYVDNYDSFFSIRLIFLIINSIILICFAALIIFSFFTGNLDLTYLCCGLFVLSVGLSITVCVILFKEVKKVKKYKIAINNINKK